jgi:RNAse (barnase) inhibitor barstar
MSDWINIFGSYSNSGVYLASDAEKTRIQQAAAYKGLDFIHIDLKRATGKRAFLKRVSEALNFPAYFGMNWDALNDSLTDLSWKHALGYVILLTDFQLLAEKAAEDFKVIRQILDSSAEYWKQKKAPFYVIMAERDVKSLTNRL